MLSKVKPNISAIKVVINHFTYKKAVGIYIIDSWGVSYFSSYNINNLYNERVRIYA